MSKNLKNGLLYYSTSFVIGSIFGWKYGVCSMFILNALAILAMDIQETIKENSR